MTFVIRSLFVISLLAAGCGVGGGGGGGYPGCIRQCSGRNCGDDGCGGTCGTCQQGYACGSAGKCVIGCTPQCSGKQCGSDGCGGSCGSCDRGFRCNGAICDVDPSGLWTLTITSGRIAERDPSGAAWDVPGGLPDAFVCLTINGTRSCTTTVMDTLTPVWNERFTAAAISLQAGVAVEIWDEDLSDNDVICGKGTLTLSTNHFTSGRWGAQCTYGSFAATLAPQ